MRYSEMVNRVGGMGDDAWEIHRRAWEKEAAGESVIILSAGEERAATTPPAIVEAAKQALDAGRHHYSPLTGSPALKAAVAARHFKLTGQTVSPESCCIMAGAQNALYSTLLCLADAGDEIIVPDPYYATYPGVCRAGGASMVTVPCDPEADFVVDPQKIAAAITSKTRVILLNSPNNPTGAIYPKAVLEAIAELAKKHDLWVISDEVYADFVYDSPHIAIGSLPGMAERTVTIGSMSKAYRMSGWRVGWLVSNPTLSAIISDLATCMLYGIAPFVQDAALAALTDETGEIEADRVNMLADYRTRRDLVCEHLSNVPGLVLRHPAAGMFVMVDVRGTGLDDFTFAARLLDEENVGVMTGAAFGPSAEGHIRLGLVAKQEVLADACTRIRRFALSLG
ncbi:MAG: pyridoxal phosphate-dependent aminotransferase [Alphaproteobacteria bacterium]|nr:pyridoxal phosphate-dependent aminotransferase [Alphaproteobacteria bacterium]